MYHPYIPPDFEGLCYPTEPGATVDVLFHLSAATRAAEAIEVFRKLVQSGADSPGAQNAARAGQMLERLTAEARSRLFSTPFAEFDLRNTQDALRETRLSSTAALLRLVRHIVGHPDAGEGMLIFPPEAFTQGRLYLPHLHASVLEAGHSPVAAIMQPDSTTFVWSDGAHVEATPQSAPSGSSFHSGGADFRLQHLPRIEQIPLLNAAPETNETLLPFEVLGGSLREHAVSSVADSLQLIEDLWPTAHHATCRHLDGLILLKSHGFARTHSPEHLPRAVLSTLDSPEKIAEMWCHEMSHVRMAVFRRHDPIAVARDPEAERAGYISPWRSDPRPIRGLIDGVHAFLNVCEFHRRLSTQPAWRTHSLFIYERQKKKIKEAWQTLTSAAVPTALGESFFSELEGEVAGL